MTNEANANKGTTTGAIDLKDKPEGETELRPAGDAEVVEGDGPQAKGVALFNKHFVGTELANDTNLWNKVVKFRDELIALLTGKE